MDKFKYKEVSAAQYRMETDDFILMHGDQKGIISNNQYDRLFDGVAVGLGEIGRFTDDGMGENGEDFISSRYVDQLPYISVVVDSKIAPRRLAEIGINIVERAHRALCLSFDCEGGYLAVFPERVAIGTFHEDQLDVPLPHKK